MKYNPAIHNRRSIRLKTYDYSKAGLYFITFCVQNRELLFGEIKNNVMILNDAGKMIYAEWEKLPERFTNKQLHEFVVMPNHFHAILEIAGAPLAGAQNAHPGETKNDEEVPAGAPLAGAHNTRKDNDGAIESNNQPINDSSRSPAGAPTTNNTLGEMMGAFKSITTVEYIKGVKNSGWQPFDGKLWQRNYYEHIIRNKEAYETITDYIINNPSR